jgi:hypothetical protein
MASRIWEIQVAVPAGTQQATPLVTPWLTEDNLLNTIELTIPPGHNGLTGIRIMKGDVPIVPYSANSFIVGNNYTHEFTVNDYVQTGDVKIQTFNVGSYSHSFYLRATVSDYLGPNDSGQGSLSQTLLVGEIQASPDPLSPDAILGVTATDGLTSGLITADDLISIPEDSADSLPGST